MGGCGALEQYGSHTLQASTLSKCATNRPFGEKEVWQWCQTVGALEHGWHEIDINADNALKWWLWLPTLAESGCIRVGKLIEKAAVQADGQTYAWFSFIDVRGDTIDIQLSVAGGKITVSAPEH